MDLADGRQVSFTQHGDQRRIEMGLSSREIADVIEGAENSYPQVGRYEGHTCWQRGKWAVVTRPKGETGLVVLTVLLSNVGRPREARWDRKTKTWSC